MIIKTKTAIVDTNTYDSFHIEYYHCKFRLLAVNRYTSDTIVLYETHDKSFVEELLDEIYSRFNRVDSCMNLKV